MVSLPYTIFKESGKYERVATSVVTIFKPCNPLSPFLWFKACKTLQLHLNSMVDDFILIICFWVIKGAKVKMSSLYSKKFFPKQACESGIRSEAMDYGIP